MTEDWMLHHIASHAEHISYSAARIANMPGKLDHQEPFRTAMEAELERAEAELLKAIDVLHEKRAEYQRLPRKVT